MPWADANRVINVISEISVDPNLKHPVVTPEMMSERGIERPYRSRYPYSPGSSSPAAMYVTLQEYAGDEDWKSLFDC